MALLDIPRKTNPDISLIHLLDENNCLKDSLTVINDNFSSLKNTLIDLDKYGEEWNFIYSVFAANSAFWLRISDDIILYNDKWNSAITTVKSLSSYWFSDMSIVWPSIVKQSEWYGGTVNSGDTSVSVESSYISNNIPSWLNSLFPPSNYDYRQKIYVTVMLQYDQYWEYYFEQSIYEPCLPDGSLIDYGMTNKAHVGYTKGIIPSSPVLSPQADPCTFYYGVPQYESCSPRCSPLGDGKAGGKKVLEDVIKGFNKNGDPIYVKCWVHDIERYSTTFACRKCPQTFSRGCNHHGGKAGHGACDNAFSYCTRTSETLEMAKGCASRNDGTLTMADTWSGVDTATSRILTIAFMKNETGKSWVRDTSIPIS